jgi:UDPglucose 6-dehydrogenase
MHFTNLGLANEKDLVGRGVSYCATCDGPMFKGKRVAVLGLAFKGDTDDMRESPAIIVVNQLIKEKADVIAYDPQAMENARKIFGKKIYYANSSRECLAAAEIALILTEWKEFKSLDFSGMKNKTVIDARRMLSRHNLTPGVEYEGLCW